MLRLFFLYFMLFVLSSPTYSSLDAFDEDIELSKNVPLVSGISGISEDIKKGDKAALTLCSVSLSIAFFSYDHIALVFEVKHPTKNEINLFSIHFGGDGDSSYVEKGRPVVDNARDTLRKVFRGREKDLISNREDYTDPVYFRRVSFVIKNSQALEALKKIQKDRSLKYSITGGQSYLSWGGNTYNCCTYIDKCLSDAGINTGFNKSWGTKTASNLVSFCLSDTTKGYLTRETPVEYYKGLEIPEYQENVRILFEKGLSSLKEQANHEDSMKYITESAKKGHSVAQCFLGFCYYNANNIKKEFERIVFYAKNASANNTDLTYFSYLLSSYDDFSSSSYFKKLIKHDEREAFEWVKRSAEKGFPRAESDLGYFYAHGKGTREEIKEAIKWYKKAAAQQDPIARSNLWSLYEEVREKEENKIITANRKQLNIQTQEEVNNKLFEIFGFSREGLKEFLNISEVKGI